MRDIFQQDPDSKKFGAATRIEPSSLTARTVIVATNAAETAVTFNKCWLCIDTCMVESDDVRCHAKGKSTANCSLLPSSIYAERRKSRKEILLWQQQALVI